jgi:hypothetical protein
VVAQHILSRLNSITARHSHVAVEFDNKTVGTVPALWGGTHVVHIEATNILVRITGTRPDLDAVLVSAQCVLRHVPHRASPDYSRILAMIRFPPHLAQPMTAWE